MASRWAHITSVPRIDNGACFHPKIGKPVLVMMAVSLCSEMAHELVKDGPRLHDNKQRHAVCEPTMARECHNPERGQR